jgi:predicted metal-dependent peptidase
VDSGYGRKRRLVSPSPYPTITHYPLPITHYPLPLTHPKMSAKRPPQQNLAAIQSGLAILRTHPIFAFIDYFASTTTGQNFDRDGFARILVKNGNDKKPTMSIELNPWQRASAGEWAYAIAQCHLHIAFNHVDPVRTDEPWRLACELIVVDWLKQIAVGEPIHPQGLPLPAQNLADLADLLGRDLVAARKKYGHPSTAGSEPSWSIAPEVQPFTAAFRQKHSDAFANGIRNAVIQAVETAGDRSRQTTRNANSLAERARRWFVANYPLLASLAAAFEIVEDAELCQQMDISLAAVNTEIQRIYINPKFPWTYPQLQFVMAHELLHVGLRHEERQQGRDRFLWNIACDYVINAWLVEMGIGEIPTPSLMLDLELGFEHESAEALYDRIVKDLRLMRRLKKERTLRGIGKSDMLSERPPSWWTGMGCDLDTFYRRALADGLDLHMAQSKRGFLPGDLVEEIKSILQPPIPWDVKLGQWLDNYFPPIVVRRSFARASRRQSSTPDIPRAVYIKPPELMAARTFGVILDTSGSMDSSTLARGLGAIASYALSREVLQVRVIQCDAGIHDMGYVEPERLLETVEVKGRGGTVLMPAIAKLEAAGDFPKDAPILVITDGECDYLTIRRAHAFLLPVGGRLPFDTRAPIFHFDRSE